MRHALSNVDALVDMFGMAPGAFDITRETFVITARASSTIETSPGLRHA